MKQSRKYMDELVLAIQHHFHNIQRTGKLEDSIYYGVQGAKRLAREFGGGLHDSPESERSEAIKESYQRLYLKAYGSNLVLKEREWIFHVNGGLARASDYSKFNK